MANANRLYRRDKAEEAKRKAAEARARERARRLNAEEIAAAGFARKQEEGLYASVLKDKASKLIGDPRLKFFANLPQLRSMSSWQPKTKSREGLFVSLCEHLFCKYPTPRFFWSVFDIPHVNHYYARQEQQLVPPPQTQIWIRTILRIARGESFYKICQAREFPVSLTRKACHLFLTSNGGSLMNNLRTAQVLSMGGDKRLANTICKSRIGRELNLGGGEIENFNTEYIQWCINNPMLSHEKIDPILDYVMRELRPNIRNFSMIGRSPVAIIRDMERWHRALRGTRWTRSDNIPSTFEPSGFRSYCVDYSTKKNREVWKIREILKSAELRSEGHRMRHCVYSYARDIVAKKISIWSLSVDRNDGEYSVVTIEVDNATRRVVQARGPCNRLPEENARRIMGNWAVSADLIWAAG